MFRSAFRPGRPEELAAAAEGPLAPQLYGALARLFGRVEVRKRGELFDYDAVPTADGPRARMRSPGELYVFNCPHCGDTRRRAWVSYMYGQPDPVEGRPMRGLVNCWNEECCDQFDRRHDFEMALLGFGGGHAGPGHFPPPDEARGRRRPRHEPRLPGLVQPLHELAADHPAVAYVRDRGFDPADLSRAFGVGYCLDADDDFAPALHRLVVPVRLNGRLVGWQARRLDGRKKFKYYTMPDMPTSRVLYNWDTLPGRRVVVLVEGVVDAWSVGPGAAALFGKDLKEGQFQLLQSLVPARPAVALCLDPGESEQAAAERARRLIEPAFPGRVVVVRLPGRAAREDCRCWPVEKVDAGCLTREAVWRLIATELVERGVEI